MLCITYNRRRLSWPNHRPIWLLTLLLKSRNCCADHFSFASTFLSVLLSSLRPLFVFDRRTTPEHLQYVIARARNCDATARHHDLWSRREPHPREGSDTISIISPHIFQFLSAAAARVPGQPPIMSSPRRRIETDVSHESATSSRLDDPAVWGLTDCLLCFGEF